MVKIIDPFEDFKRLEIAKKFLSELPDNIFIEHNFSRLDYLEFVESVSNFFFIILIIKSLCNKDCDFRLKNFEGCFVEIDDFPFDIVDILLKNEELYNVLHF